MSSTSISSPMVGNEFLVPRRSKIRPINQAPIIEVTMPVTPIQPSQLAEPEMIASTDDHVEVLPVVTHNHSAKAALAAIYRHSVIVFAVLSLLVGAAAIEVGSGYWSAHVMSNLPYKPVAARLAPAIAGLNTSVDNQTLAAKLQTIESQPASLTVGSHTISISPSTIKSWLTVSTNNTGGTSTIHVNPAPISASLIALANKFVATPVNQVTSTSSGAPAVIVTGQNGSKLTDPSGLAAQAHTMALNVLSAKGLQATTPLQTLPFQAVTTAAFPKLIEANLTTKMTYFYQNGQLVNSFASSDGKPSTPTPVGEFHIWDKLTSQTMTGPGYVQPNVPYVNYFDHSGDAVHGVYWRPASVFGNVNTSHGCVGLPVSEAAWVFNWAPVGTTVITHN